MENKTIEEQAKNQTPKKIEEPKMRQIVIETDGNNINIVKAEVSGSLEFKAVLEALLKQLNKE